MSASTKILLALALLLGGSAVVLASGGRPDYTGFLRCIEHLPDEECRKVHGLRLGN